MLSKAVIGSPHKYPGKLNSASNNENINTKTMFAEYKDWMIFFATVLFTVKSCAHFD